MIKAKRNENGELSVEQKLNRFLNLIQLVYMESEKNSDSDCYSIPSQIIERIESELTVNTNKKLKKQIISEQIMQFRKRKSYAFWSDILFNGNYTSYDSAKKVLMSIMHRTQHNFHTITQEKYSMETMLLALDDYFGTNTLKFIPNLPGES